MKISMSAETLQSLLGNKLKYHRKFRGLTQSELSEKSGVSLEYISKIERGLASPSFHVIDELAYALDIDPVDFFVESMPACMFQLREVNHRIKNNYQILSNLLLLAREDSDTEKDARLMDEIRLRISTMAATHDLLTGEGSDSHDFKDFLRRLFARLRIIYGLDDIVAEFDLEDMRLAPPTATALGMVANELLANALKHGAENLSPLTVKVSLKSDNGNGILTVRNSHSEDAANEARVLPKSGLSIIRNIVHEQLKGDFSFHTSKEAVAEVVFPLNRIA
jgi:two-component sensor histidine kinase